jgi:hypothetical protein
MDDAERGLGLRVKPSGKKRYFWTYPASVDR